MRDPRPRFQAWLNRQGPIDDALVTSSVFFVVAWPLLVVMGLATWSPDDALTFAFVSALPMGCWVSYRRRKRSSADG